MQQKNSVKTAHYKKYVYGVLAFIMYFIPLYYYQSLKDTPFLGFNNKETNVFIYVVIIFFAVFITLGIIFSLFALKKYEKKKIEIKKNRIIFAIEIITLVVNVISLIYLIIYYNKIIFFLLIPVAVYFVLLLIQIFRKFTHKRRFIVVIIACLIFTFSSVSLSFFEVRGSIEYNNQSKFLSEMLQGQDIDYNKYGGWENYPQALGAFEATGYFYTTKQNGRHWFVDPAGKPFISKGMNHVDVDYGSDYESFVINKHGSIENWAENALDLLRDNGFNTITSWSNEHVINKDMPYTILLNFGDQYKWRNELGSHYNNKRPDVLNYFGDFFSEEFEIVADEIAERLVKPYSESEYLLGYFTDNELIWGVDWRNDYTLIQIFMSYPDTSPGKNVLIEMLEEKTETVEAFNLAFRTSINSFEDLWELPWDSLDVKSNKAKEFEEEFGGLLAERYSKVTHDAIRKYDNNHLILGCRFAFYPNEKIFVNASLYVDVISYAGYFNSYYYTFGSKENLDALYEEINKPMILGEYGVRALDSNMPNFLYSGPVMLNQKQRAAEASIFIERFMYQPYAIGYHWYKFADNEKFGLLNGENYGIIDRKEQEYTTFNYLIEKTNQSLELIHISEERDIKYRGFSLWG